MSKSNKKELRQILRHRLKMISTSDRQEKQIALSRLLNGLVNQICSEKLFTSLGVFSPLSDEPVWWSQLSCDLEWLAVHVNEGEKLSFHPVVKKNYCQESGVLKLSEESLGITSTPELVLVPGLGFTRQGERLGRGKGFYDRYLQDFTGVTIGVFFSESECESVLAESHDMILDYIVTEKEVLKIKR